MSTPARPPTSIARWLRILAVGVLASAAAQVPPASAWVGEFPCGGGFSVWANGDYEFRIDTDDYPTTGWKHDAIHAVADRFHGLGSPIPGSAFNPRHGFHTTGGSANHGDNISSVNFDDLTGGLIGETTCSAWNCVLVTCDIVLDSTGVSWMDGAPDDDSQPYSFRATFAHELGHAAGLDHQANFADTMNGTYPFGGSISNIVSASEDVRVGLRNLYPHSSTGTDLGNSSFFWTSAAGKAMRSPDSGNFGCQQLDNAAAGGQIKRSHCVHALGTTSETVTQNYYLSTDATITTADTLIGTFSIAASPDSPNCPCRTLTIPSGTPSRTYRIGSLLDPSDNITEANESNNDSIDLGTFTVN